MLGARVFRKAFCQRTECSPTRRISRTPAVSLTRGKWSRRRDNEHFCLLPTFGTLPFATGGAFESLRCYSGDVKQKNESASTMAKLNLSIFDMDAMGINAYVQTADDLETLVEQVEDLESLTQADMQPLIRPLITACDRIEPKDRAADLAERILFICLARLPSDVAERFDENTDASDPVALLPYPDQAIYTKVISVLGSLRSEDAANRANRLFRLMTAEYRAEQMYLNQSGKHLRECSVRAAKPSASTFKSLLRAWSIAGTANASKEAENVLVEMERLGGLRDSPAMDHSFSIAPPDIECYNMVLTSYSRVDNRRHPLVFDRARGLFRRMEELEQGNFMLQWFSYNAFLKCIQSHMRGSTVKIQDDVIENLERIIPRLCSMSVPKSFLKRFEDQGVHPRAWALGVIIEAILHETRDEIRVRKADSLLCQMVGEVPFEGILLTDTLLVQLWPSQQTLASVAQAWRESKLDGYEHGLERIRSFVIETSYVTLHHAHVAMQAWEESGIPEAPDIVEAILDRTLNESSQLEPTGQTFAIAMRTWMRSSHQDRGNKVESLLFRMHDLYKERMSNRYVANETHFILALQAWQTMSKDGKKYPGIHGVQYPAEHAVSLLRYMQASNVWDPRNYNHYSTALKAWSQQVVTVHDQHTFPAREAAALLADMEQRSGECPPANICNLVLQACVRDDILDSQKREAYSIATETFNKGSHNAFSYILAVEIVKRSVKKIQDDQLRFIESIVKGCRDSGQLTQALLYEAIEVLDKGALKRLFKFSDSYAETILKHRSTNLARTNGRKLRWIGPQHPHGLRVENLPKTWSLNTKNGRP